MFRLIASLVILVLFQTVCAIENVPKFENPELKYIYKGVVPITASPRSIYSNGFIGDLEIGKLTINDRMLHVFRFNGTNDSSILQTFNLMRVTFSDKIVTYVGVFNEENSYGAVCGELNDLGSNQSPRFWVRLAPRTNVQLTMLIFGQDISQENQ